MNIYDMVDISEYQHPGGAAIDWTRVHEAGVRAVFIQATYGIAGRNPYVEQDSADARAAGLLVGHYHFAYPAESTAQGQVDHLMSVIDGLDQEIGTALDLEVQDGWTWAQLGNWGARFLAGLPQSVVRRILYCNDDWLANLPGAPWGHLLWLAQTYRPRRRVYAWQQTATVLVPGIVGPVDRDTLYLG